MKQLIKSIKNRRSKKSEQQRLVEFVTSDKIIRKVIVGSMKKRNELLSR